MAAAGLACGGCATVQSIGDMLMSANVFSTADEVQFGQQFAAEIEKEAKPLNNAAVQNYVRQVGARVAAKSPRQDVQYHFMVIDAPKEVNAFAVPGGYIYVYTGLLKKMDNEAELAGVLAHEAGHVAAKHSMKQMTRQMGYDTITQMLLGQQKDQWQGAAAQLVGELGFLHFSREQEREADHLAVGIARGAGYDARGLETFLGKLVAMQQYEPNVVERMLATHPAPSERRTNVAQEIQTLGGTPGEVAADRYKAAMAKLP